MIKKSGMATNQKNLINNKQGIIKNKKTLIKNKIVKLENKEMTEKTSQYTQENSRPVIEAPRINKIENLPSDKNNDLLDKQCSNTTKICNCEKCEKCEKCENFHTIGIGITGSFCTHEKILVVIKSLVNKGYNVIPIITDEVKNTDTRFGSASEFIQRLKDITRNEIIDSLVSAEPIGPKNLIDILLIAPCTGNTLAKLSHAITDNAVNMVFKSHIRNNKPVVIGISTNDALGLNMVNIGTLLNTKNIFFVPFGQDDYNKKPKSLICDWELIEQTLISAWSNTQLQPLLLKEKI